MARLERAVTDGKIFTHDKRTILEMSKKVLENIAFKHRNVQKEVKEIMGGKVLEYEGRNIFYEGIEQGRSEGIELGRSEGIELGRSEGRSEGRTETLNAAIDFMRSNGMSDDKINDFKNLIPILKN